MKTRRWSATRPVFLLLMAICGGVDRFAAAATLPTGFNETPVAAALASPTAMQFAPDGRLFVCEQGGQLRVIKDGALLPTPFLTLTVSSVGERGLLGVAFDPAFATNHIALAGSESSTPPRATASSTSRRALPRPSI